MKYYVDERISGNLKLTTAQFNEKWTERNESLNYVLGLCQKVYSATDFSMTEVNNIVKICLGIPVFPHEIADLPEHLRRIARYRNGQTPFVIINQKTFEEIIETIEQKT